MNTQTTIRSWRVGFTLSADTFHYIQQNFCVLYATAVFKITTKQEFAPTVRFTEIAKYLFIRIIIRVLIQY